MSTSDGEHTGAMIALVPSEADLDRLALVNGEPRDELHLTLYYLGDAVNIDEDTRVELHRGVVDVANITDAFEANAFGVAYWNPTGPEPAWVLNVGDVSDRAYDERTLAEVRALVDDAVRVNVPNFEMVPQHTPWQPHICLAYTTEDVFEAAATKLGSVTFDRIRLAFGGQVWDVPLSQPATVSTASGGGLVTTDVVDIVNDVSAAISVDDAPLIVDEVSTTDATDVALAATKVTTSELVAGELVHHMPDGSVMTDAEFKAAARWQGPLVVEGVTTGDGREFSPDALTWAEHALLRWQKEGSHGGDHDVTVSVGRIDEVWREGNQIMGRGVLDLSSADGFEIYRRMKNGFAGGISIDADDITEADIEIVWAEDQGSEGETEEDDMIMLLFGTPEKLIYHSGRVRAATLCDIPAFVEAYITLVGDESVEAVTASVAVIESAVTPVHTTETTDAPWQWTVGKHRASRSAPRDAFAVMYDGVGHLMHHELNADGSVGPANLTACATALKDLTSKRGMVVKGDERGVYEHLAGHLRDAGQEPPPFKSYNALAASFTLPEVLWKPPRAWFDDPKLSVPTGITVTDMGRVYGHVAPWGECHIGIGDQCVTPPREDSHPYFMTGEVVCDDGTSVAVGQITVSTGHAPLSYSATHATEHYDNTGVAVVDIAVGNDMHGIWAAGAVRPYAEAARVHELRASGKVSGDWRRVGWQLRLIGVLGVNVPGFPMPRLRARVASGATQALVAAGTHLMVGRPAPAPTDADLDQQAMRRVMDIFAQRMRTSSEEGAE